MQREKKGVKHWRKKKNGKGRIFWGKRGQLTGESVLRGWGGFSLQNKENKKWREKCEVKGEEFQREGGASQIGGNLGQEKKNLSLKHPGSRH